MPATYQEIVPEELGLWRTKGAQLVDVREPWEYAGGHIPGAVNIPLETLAARTQELREPLVLVCASGNRSGKAAQALVDHGYLEVANLLGGTASWKQRGLPLE